MGHGAMRADPGIVQELLQHTLQEKPDPMADTPDTRIWGCGCRGWSMRTGIQQAARAYRVHVAEALEPIIRRRMQVYANPGPAIAALLKARDAGKDEADTRVYTSDEILEMIERG